jgi:hypothetical protein
VTLIQAGVSGIVRVGLHLSLGERQDTSLEANVRDIIRCMTLQELEKTISDLPPEELSKFREWFVAFDAKNWDQQLEADVTAGRLDVVADEAIREHQAGESTEL